MQSEDTGHENQKTGSDGGQLDIGCAVCCSADWGEQRAADSVNPALQIQRGRYQEGRAALEFPPVSVSLKTKSGRAHFLGEGVPRPFWR
jgi:hypothetical protein